MNFLGIDAGGSKTILAVCDEAGQVQRTARLPAVTLAACGGEDGMRQALSDGVRQVLPDGTLDGVCFGVPCYGESDPGDAAIDRVAAACFAGAAIEVCNDSRVAWAGSLALAPGINIVTGTGAIGYGVDPHGNAARCGGWSYHFSDEGSGYWLGLKCLSLFSKQSDGRIPERGPLYTLVRERLGLVKDFDLNDLAERDYLPYRDRVAGLQRILLEAAQQGDESAIACYHEAGQEIALIARGILAQLDFGGSADVSYSGGIFNVGALVMDSFAASLTGCGCRIIRPEAPPWAGALMLALRTRGKDMPAALSNLIQEGQRCLS